MSYLRRTAGFTGLVVLDTPEWSSQNDGGSFRDMVSYDASLLGGTANVAFSNHWYPNIPIDSEPNLSDTYVKTILPLMGTYPLVIGEIGQENPGSSPTTPQYVTDILNLEVQTAIPGGHNGIFAWIWSWCDINNMTANWDDYLNLSTYGQLYQTYYWSKVPGMGGTVFPSATNSPGNNQPTQSTLPTIIAPGNCHLKSMGDANCDGRVSLTDMEIFRREFNSPGTGLDADFNGDGKVSLVDFEILRRNFGLSL